MSTVIEKHMYDINHPVKHSEDTGTSKRIEDNVQVIIIRSKAVATEIHTSELLYARRTVKG